MKITKLLVLLTASTGMLAAGVLQANAEPSRLGLAAVSSTATAAATTAQQASAAPSWDSPFTVVGDSCWDGTDASISAGGTIVGFTSCDERLKFFQNRDTTRVVVNSPYKGTVIASAWDGSNATYVLFQQDGHLKLGKRTHSTGTFGTPIILSMTFGHKGYDADLVARDGKYWAVWSQSVGGAPYYQSELFQRRTLNGPVGTTQITNTAANVNDTSPALAYADGKLTLVWARKTGTDPTEAGVIKIATSTGSSWTSRTFASVGDHFVDRPRVAVSQGKTYVIWVRDFSTYESDNASGTWVSHRVGAAANAMSISVSAGNVFIGSNPSGSSGIQVYQRKAGVWSSFTATGSDAYPQAVLAQAGKGHLLYTVNSGLKVRHQS